jgi:hypothetical protein
MFRRPLAAIVGLSLVSLLVSPVDAVAETVIKFELAGMSTGPDMQFNAGTLSTIDDGVASTFGDQNTNVSYQGFLEGLTDIAAGASMTISGVDKVGDASDVNGIVSQVTSGGTFFLYDQSDFLLLSGGFAGGVVVGSVSDSAGSFFTTSPLMYTGGSLLDFVIPKSGKISLSFTDVRTGGSPGMVVTNGNLADFTSVATGSLEATAVPEPSVLGMAAIGVLLVVRHHRRRRQVAAAL